MLSHTKDEKFLIALYESAVTSGDHFEERDMYSIGQLVGANERTTNNIVKILAQTNFVKREEGHNISLTAHGLKLVFSLLKI